MTSPPAESVAIIPARLSGPEGAVEPHEWDGRAEVDVSIIVCAHDRPAALSDLLASLKGLSVPEGVRWEVLVIGNNPTGATQRAAEGYVEAFPGRFAFIIERGRGKSHALNAGVRLARGRIFAFTDDDCIVDPHWISSILSEYASDPELAVLSGRVELYDKSDKVMTVSPFR